MPIKPFTLQFPAAQLHAYSEQFSYKRDPTNAIAAGTAAADDGYYSLDGLLAVIDWKSPRSKSDITASDEEIKQATGQAFEADTEPARMEALTTLDGIGVPIASALLLYALGETYPILDRKALASLNHRPRGRYPTEFWVRYLNFVRDVAVEHGMTARAVEKALWEHAHQNEAHD